MSRQSDLESAGAYRTPVEAGPPPPGAGATGLEPAALSGVRQGEEPAQMESRRQRVKRLYAEFEKLGVPTVRATVDVGRLGKSGNPSETKAAVHWLKLKTEEQINDNEKNHRSNKRRWIITTIISTAALLFGMLGLVTGALALISVLKGF